MISPDLPITKSSEDILNRSIFAKSLAKTLTQYSFSSSFTIGLYGAWGSGKTSLINMVLDNVGDIDENVIILRFNPWLCADPKQLIIQFFKQMSAAIKLKKPTAKKTWELIDQYADIFELANLVPVAGSVIAVLGKVLAIKARKQMYKQKGDIQDTKNQIINKLIEEKIKIIVSIDDIDRLSEEEIIAVFQLVKSLADFPNTLYLLAFDYDVVIHALSKVQNGNGKEYLEKIIQMPFEIPVPNYINIQDFLFSKLDEIIGNIPEERLNKKVWSELFQFSIKKYIKSIRDVIRYTNVFSLKFELLKDETDWADLLGITALQVFEPTIYSKLPYYKDMLCGQNLSYSHENNKKEEEIKKIISQLIPEDGTINNVEAARYILAILFPKINTYNNIMYNNLGRSYSKQVFLMDHNIAIPECFNRYFELTLEDEAIPTAIIRQMIFDSSEQDFADELLRHYREGKLIRLLEEINAYADRTDSLAIPASRATVILRTLCRNWNTFEISEKGFFSIPFNWRLLFCVDALLKVIKKEDRFSYIKSIFEDEKIPASIVSLLLEDFENQLGRFTDEVPDKGNAMFSEEEVLELEIILKNRAVDALDSGSAIRQRHGLNFLWILEKIDAELVTSIKKELIKDDNALAKVISYCTARGTTATNVIKYTLNIDRRALGTFIDETEAYRRIKEFINTDSFLSLPREDKMNVIAFTLIIERKEDGKQSVLEGSIEENYVEQILKQILKGK